MWSFIFYGVVAFVVCYSIFYHIRYVENVKAFIGTGRDLYLKDIMLFSNKELAKRIRDILDKGAESIKIVYYNDKCMVVDKDDSLESILRMIESIQHFLIGARYTESVNSAIDDDIDEKILDIWLDYGHSKRYRKIFSREISRMLNSGEIANSTFNRMYQRFYYFDRSEFEVKKS